MRDIEGGCWRNLSNDIETIYYVATKIYPSPLPHDCGISFILAKESSKCRWTLSLGCCWNQQWDMLVIQKKVECERVLLV